MFDNSSPDFRIFHDIIQMRQNFLGIHDWTHPRYALYDYPQRLCLLSDMNRVYTLRELGHIPKFLEVENEINKMPGKQASPQDKCILDMATWVQTISNSIQPFASEKERVVISLFVYGNYIDRCINVMFKSLMSPGNLAALCAEKQAIFHIQTDEKGQKAILESAIAQRMIALGAAFEFAIISDSLMEQLDSTSIYWMVGAAATVGIEYARKSRAAFHHSYPDIIYSNRFFSELLRLTKLSPAILSPAHRTDESIMLPAAKKYEDKDCISIPSADLVALGLNAVHMCHWPTIVNNRPAAWVYPQTHSLVWETNEFMHFNCPHLNALWLAPEIIEKVPERFYISLDSELDFLCEGENFYIPQETDDLYIVEFSNQGKQKVEDFYLTSENYSGYFWKLSTNRDNLKFFTRGMKLRINRDIRPAQYNTMAEDACMNEKVFLFNSIISKDPGVGTTLSRPRTHLGRIYGISRATA